MISSQEEEICKMKGLIHWWDQGLVGRIERDKVYGKGSLTFKESVMLPGMSTEYEINIANSKTKARKHISIMLKNSLISSNPENINLLQAFYSNCSIKL